MEKQLNLPQPPPARHTENALWQRIEQFELDEQGAEFPFSKKLAKEQGWDPDFTKLAIREYKRFVYLCCISPEGASPSEIVDEVWHLHLNYTVNYWDHFCGEILQRKLHHHPSNGGMEETKRHNHWLQQTLTLYRNTFHEEPPAIAWQSACASEASKRATKLPKFPFRSGAFILIVLLSCSLSSCGSDDIGAALPPILFVLIMGMLSKADKQKKDSRHELGSGDSSSGCGGSSCSGDGGGCGSGCGGCGGGGD